MMKVVKHSTNGVIQFRVAEKQAVFAGGGVRRLSVCPGGVPASELRCCQATLDSLLVMPGSASITNIRTPFSSTKLWFLHILTPFWTEVNPQKAPSAFPLDSRVDWKGFVDVYLFLFLRMVFLLLQQQIWARRTQLTQVDSMWAALRKKLSLSFKKQIKQIKGSLLPLRMFRLEWCAKTVCTTCRVTKVRPRDPAHDRSTDALESWPVWPLMWFFLAWKPWKWNQSIQI